MEDISEARINKATIDLAYFVNAMRNEDQALQNEEIAYALLHIVASLDSSENYARFAGEALDECFLWEDQRLAVKKAVRAIQEGKISLS